jgi:hypothetical protein
MRRSPLVLVVVSVAVALLAQAPAATAAPQPWATVNVCDTAASPNTVGIRGSMPGRGRGVVAHMRFRLQYRAPNGAWKPVGPAADSGWQRLAAMPRGVVESGWSFELRPPAGGVLLRGRVGFRWTRGNRVLRTDRRLTSGGRRSTAGSDPPGFSAATCLLR